MSASSTARVILSSIRKIYIPIIVLLVFCIPFLGFTEYATADTSTNISSFTATGDYVSNKDVFLTITLPDDSIKTVKATVYLDRYQNGGMLNLFLQPHRFDTFLGSMNLSKQDLLSFLDGFYIRLNICDSIDADGSYIYGDLYEMCYLPVSLFNESVTLNGSFFHLFTYSNYFSFVIGDILSFAYPDFSNFKYTGTYSDVKATYGDNAYYCYILQTLKRYINFAPVEFDNFNNSKNSLSIKAFTALGFSHLDTEEFKLYKKTLQDAISNGLSSTNQKIDDLLNYGSGSFDDIEQDIDNASDKAEQGNQEIEDNAPKPDIDNTHDDTTDIIDSVLTEHGENVSNILGAILGSNIVNGMLLISISVGAIKYIFFGKG